MQPVCAHLDDRLHPAFIARMENGAFVAWARRRFSRPKPRSRRERRIMALYERLPTRLHSRLGRGAGTVRVREEKIWLGGVQATRRLMFAGIVGAALAFLVFWIAFLGLVSWAVGTMI
jgi:hypothetical protein